MSNPYVILSGVHSGTNPSPGLGTARSIRAAWPDALIAAIDYSILSTGLHARIFDRTHVLPAWEEVDVVEAAQSIALLTEKERASFISGLDLETHVLARYCPNSPRLLLPPETSLRLSRKPAAKLASILGLNVPRTCPVESSAGAVQFAESHGWPIWVKGPYYEAALASSPAHLLAAIHRIRQTWGTSDTLLQEHIEGSEESIAFAAFKGQLLNACYMTKLQVTPDGKTWSGSVQALDLSQYNLVDNFIKSTSWTGGGEIEVVRSTRDGRLWLIDLNPRFPAWIHGATLAGFNLPASLVEAATGVRPAANSQSESSTFVRVVEEIAADFRDSHYSLGRTDVETIQPAKAHPSGMPVLSRRAFSEPSLRPTEGPQRIENDSRVEVLSEHCRPTTVTPASIFFPDILDMRIAKLRRFANSAASDVPLSVQVAYSVKTNPDERILNTLQRAGIMAETISLHETARCIYSGYSASDIILNGPGKWWGWDSAETPRQANTVFCDSLEDFDRTIALVETGQFRAKKLGLRLGSTWYKSRFGMSLSQPDIFGSIVDRLASRKIQHPLAVLFHLAPSSIGVGNWVREASGVVRLAAALERAAGVRIQTVDLGGGWSPSALDNADAARALHEVVSKVHEYLPSAETVFIEPGKSLVEPCMAVLSKVLEVRSFSRSRGIILDASVAEVPDWISFPHEIWWRRASGNQWFRLNDGHDMVLGRLCMEHDIPRNDVELPEDITAGDYVALMDTGAYDASMAYKFGA